MSLIPYSRQSIDQTDIDAVVEALKSDFVTQGPQIEAFENALANETGARYAIAVSSGTAALHLAVAALNIGPGDSGITSPITFAASANAFLYTGSDVSFADVDPKTGLISPDSIEEILSSTTQKGAIIPVSLQGRVPDLPKIHALATYYGWSVIEDAAHSLGATYFVNANSFKSASCSHSDAAILSFHPLKHICTGEGGAVLTNNEDLANRIRLLRSHGITRPTQASSSWFYEQTDLGFNYRMTSFQAALGISQLRRLPDFLAKINVLAARYRKLLSKDPFPELFSLNPEAPGHAYHLFVIHFQDHITRDEAHTFLKGKGILTQVHYRPVYKFPYYQNRYGYQSLPGSERYANSCLAIPIYPDLSFDDQDRVVDALKQFSESLIISVV